MKNLFNYDPVLSIPLNFPKDMDPVYITDSQETANAARKHGWIVYIITDFLNADTSFKKRCAVAYINCYPEKLIPELNKYTYIFICDSNVQKLDSNYTEFVNKSNNNKALYITSGWYSGKSNTILMELDRSLNNGRWSYNFNEIKKASLSYLNTLIKNNIDINLTPVVSAKYIGWNISHPSKNKLADFVYEEYSKHLQGNIILSFALHIYKDDIEHYTGFLNDGAVSSHICNY
jgi:hypothetical protein